MADKVINKIVHLDGIFKQKSGVLPTADEPIESIYIEGYANTTDVDRSGDIITQDAWEQGMENYLKNPIILVQHDHDEPIGRMEEHKVDSKGLWVKARISAAAEETFNLIKDGIYTTFSVGFRIKDAIYDSVTDLFVIKELELIEISVVSVPCNQNSIFSISKSFDSEKEAKDFRKQFVSASTSAKEHDNNKETELTNKKGINMDPKELEALLAKVANDTATAVEKKMAEKSLLEKETAEKETAEKEALKLVIAEAVKVEIKSGESGAEKLLAEIEARFATKADETKEVLSGLEAALKEKTEEIAAIQKSRMEFSDKGDQGGLTYDDREKAVFLSKLSRKAIDNTAFGQELIEKFGAHTASSTWETEVSLNLENEIRSKLVIAPTLRTINMHTNVMRIPVNPDAGIGTWMVNTAFGTTGSTGAAQTHAINEIILNSYKLATLEYLNFEEEEDSLIVLLPIIRDAMVRRVARGLDRAFLRGSGVGADPVKGIATFDATSAVVATNVGKATMANMRALRRDLGVWGLDPSSLKYIVSSDVYFDLLEDTAFQSVNQVGLSNATLLTGQVGVIGQTPVLVSDEFSVKAGGAATASTNIGAVCLAPGNFIAGDQRGLRFDTQDLVETQRTALVASMRAGLTQMSTSNGPGVSTLRWS